MSTQRRLSTTTSRRDALKVGASTRRVTTVAIRLHEIRKQSSVSACVLALCLSRAYTSLRQETAARTRVKRSRLCYGEASAVL